MIAAVCARWVSLSLSAVTIMAALSCAVMARRLRIAATRAQTATRNAIMLTTRIVSHTAPYLECQVCGGRLDLRVGAGIGLDEHGQLQLRCGEHQEDITP